jgi:hypothetical protein
VVVAADPGADPALGLELQAPAPNPAGGQVAVRFSLPETGAARLAVYDALGREVVELVDEDLPAGAHSVLFDAGGLAPGVYVLRVEADGAAVARRMAVR